MKFRRITVTESHTADLIVVVGTIVGLLLRIALPLMSRFPLNDGGLFYTLIRDLQANRYALPAFTTYNHADIPFAYPPFAFYAAGLLADLTHADLLDILRLLPPIIGTATIPVVYHIGRGIFPRKMTAALASLLFAFTPRVFAWMIMGGGITRSLGFLFALLTIASAIRLFYTHSIRLVIWTSFWSALTIVTHPEAIPQTALAVFVLYLFRDRSIKGLLGGLVVALLALSLSAPWWLTVIRAHGLEPFLAAATAVNADSGSFLVRLFSLFRFAFTDEVFLPVIAVLGLVGILFNLVRRELLLPAWLVSAYLIEPRGGTLYMMLPLLLSAAQRLDGILFRKACSDEAPVSAGRGARLLMGYLALYLFVAGFAAVYKIHDRATLSGSQIRAMDWVRNHTSPDAVFLIITGKQPLLDPASDWFPALSGRISAATVFGYEWINNGHFHQRIENYNNLQACAARDADCLESWSAETGIEFTYVLVHTDSEVFLLESLESSESYSLLFKDEQTRLYQYAR